MRSAIDCFAFFVPAVYRLLGNHVIDCANSISDDVVAVGSAANVYWLLGDHWTTMQTTHFAISNRYLASIIEWNSKHAGKLKLRAYT